MPDVMFVPDAGQARRGAALLEPGAEPVRVYMALSCAGPSRASCTLPMRGTMWTVTYEA
jgi:hypothetical protein